MAVVRRIYDRFEFELAASSAGRIERFFAEHFREARPLGAEQMQHFGLDAGREAERFHRYRRAFGFA